MEQKPLEWFAKWSEGYLALMSRRQRLYKETTESVLGIARDLMDRQAPEQPMKKLCGSMLELYNMPLSVIGSNGGSEELSREFQKFITGAPFAVSGNGFSEEIKAYGKATWENGSRASSACMNWLKELLREQKLTADGKEAGQVVKSCLELTESFLEQSAACWMDQVKTNSGLVKASLLKDTISA
jgi:hypothetical protein